MVLHDDGQVVVENNASIMHKPQLEAILILQGIGLKVTKHSGCWEIVCKPGRSAIHYESLARKASCDVHVHSVVLLYSFHEVGTLFLSQLNRAQHPAGLIVQDFNL